MGSVPLQHNRGTTTIHAGVAKPRLRAARRVSHPLNDRLPPRPPGNYFMPERSWGSPPQRIEPSEEPWRLVDALMPSCRSLTGPSSLLRIDDEPVRDFRALLPSVSRAAPEPDPKVRNGHAALAFSWFGLSRATTR